MRKIGIIIAFFLTISTGATVMAFELDVNETTLDNGLTLLTLEDRSDPVFTIMLWVPAGGITEEEGKTGISHFLEHSYSMGSDKLEPRELSRLVNSWGGYKNAFTGEDYTAYYESLPSGHLEKIIELEADRLATLALPEDKFNSEKLVIMEERRQRVDNSHYGALWERMDEIAYGEHPYGHPVIGYMEDLENLEHADLAEYYKTHYTPKNICYVLVGDFETDRAVELFNKYFGEMAPGKKVRPRVPELEKGKEEKRAVLFKETEAPVVYIGYPAVSIDHKDGHALILLKEILSGGGSSRFSRILKNRLQIVNFANARFSPQRSTALFTLLAEARAGTAVTEVERALYEILEDVKKNGVTAEELKRVKKTAEASFLLDLESTMSRAMVIGRYQTLSDEGWKYVNRYLGRIRAVTAEDIVRAAKKYLTADNRRVVTMLPEGSKIESEPVLRTHNEIKEYTFGEGLKLLFWPTDAIPGLSVRIGVPAGAARAPGEKAGLASVTSELLFTGTDRFDEEEIAEAFENIGAGYESSCGYDSAMLSFDFLTEDFGTLFPIISNIVRSPSFEEDKISRVVDEHISDFRSDRSKAYRHGSNVFREELYREHPYGSIKGGYEETLRGITREDILRFHERAYDPSKMIVAVAGKIDEDFLLEGMERYLLPGASGGEQDGELSEPADPEGRKIVLIDRDDQTQAYIKMGYPSIKRNSPDFESYAILNRILGGSGLASRLASKVRTEQGLAYSIYSSLQPMKSSGPFIIGLQTKNAAVATAIESIFAEIERLKSETVPEEELENIKRGYLGSLPFQIETNGRKAMAMLNGAFNDLPLDYMERRNEKIEGLTPEDIRETARKYLSVENIVIVMVTEAEEVAGQLESFGEVEIRDSGTSQ